MVEKVRYSSLWPILRIYDTVFLWLASLRLPKARLSVDSSNRRCLQIATPEDQRHIAIKVYASLEFCYEEDYDFVLRTTSNSIFHLERVIDFLRKSKSHEFLYAGREVKSLNRPSFVSGSFLLLNKNSIRFLLESRRSHNYGVLDDVAIGRVVSRNSNQFKRVFLNSMDFGSFDAISEIASDEILKTTHYRCKDNNAERKDLQFMLMLSKKLKELGVPYI